MKNILHFTLSLLLVFGLSHYAVAQNITIEIDPLDIGAINDINQTGDCYRQNSNNWYGNVCNTVDDGDDPQNTACDDCTIGGSEDMDVGALWNVGSNWSGAVAIGDATCGYKSSFALGGSNTTWVVSKTETVKIKISGAEDDSFACSGDLSGSNDGECSPSPYAYNNTLPWAYKAYNANTSTWFTQNTGAGVDIDSRCPYGWSGYNYGTIENCMKENGTNDYSFRWRYRWHFGNTSGTFSGMDSPNINGTDYTTCGGSYNRSTLTASSYTSCDYATQWQYSFNDGSWSDISGATSNTYDPPNRTEGKHEYRVRKAYRTSFSGSTGYTYSNIRTDIIGHTPTHVSMTNSSNCWQANNSNTYVITQRVTDNGSGIDRIQLLINYQDTGGNDNAGYFSWDNDAYTWTGGSGKNYFTTGGGFACQYNGTGGSPTGYGRDHINLVAFNTYTSGSDRYVVWTLRPDTDFPEGTDMDASWRIFGEDAFAPSNCDAGWTNYNLNFTAYRSPFATASVSNSSICTSDAGTASTTFTLSNPSPDTFSTWEYRWNNTGVWNDWSNNNPHTWNPTGNCGNDLYVRAVSTYGNCTEYSNVVVVNTYCDASGTVAQTNPDICEGGNTEYTATISTGSFNYFQYQWDGTGGSYSGAWLLTNPDIWYPGTPTTNGRDLYVRARLTNGACTNYTAPILTELYFDPTAPTITRSPNTGTVCEGTSLDVVLNNAGLYGISDDGSACEVQYRYSTNNGVSWTSWSTSAPAFTAVVGTNLYQARRFCDGSGCSDPTTQVSWNVVVDPATPTATKSPNAATVCVGQTLSLTSPSGSGGTGTCNYQYQYSTNGGSTYTGWSTSVPSFAATGTNNRTTIRTNCNGNGCDVSGYSEYTWNVSPDPTVSASGATTICSGGTASLNSSSSGGTGTCGLQWQIATAGIGGPYTNIGGATGASYNTTALTATTWYRVVNSCSGNHCNTATSNIVEVTVNPDPTAGSINKSPNQLFVCEGTNVSATFTPGSGGGGTVSDVYQYRTNGGAWSSYTPSTNISTTGLVSVEVRTRREATGSGCTNSGWVSTTWNVDPAHGAATTTTGVPAVICAGDLVTLSTDADANGTGGQIDWYTGPGGTGTFVGTGAITTDNPVANTTYYAYVNGTSCPNLESSTSVTVHNTNFVTLPATSTYNNLAEQCTINGWTYYALSGTPNEWLFAIRKNVQSVVPTFDVDLASHSGVISSVNTGTPSHGSYLMRRYWNVSLTSGSIANGIDIRFYYDPADMAAAVAARDADFLTYNGSSKGPTPQWFKTNAASGGFHPSLLTPGMGNDWTFPFTFFGPGSSTGTENGITYVQFDGLTSLSGGTGGTTFGEANALLPVELVSLTANANDASIFVNWVTASEINNEKFEVLRSTDAVTFTKIGEVAGNGTSNATNTYSFEDEDVEVDVIYYYKLRQIDFDGAAENSHVVSAVINTLGQFMIGDLVPNPANNYSYVEIISPVDGNINFFITNVVGQEMMTGEFVMEEGSQRLYFDIETLLPGNYIITMITDSGMKIARKVQIIR